MIEQRFGLPPLTVRDRTANDLAGELTTRPDLRAPTYNVPAGPFGGACRVPPRAPPVPKPSGGRCSTWPARPVGPSEARRSLEQQPRPTAIAGRSGRGARSPD